MGRGRGGNYGGGQSSLGYLLGGADNDTVHSGGAHNAQPPQQTPPSNGAVTEPSKDLPEHSINNNNNVIAGTETETGTGNGAGMDEISEKCHDSFSVINQDPKFSAHNRSTNNYTRENGQNCGNFVTNRLSTKVSAAPGGSSHLGYLFGGDKN